jgi:CheY-like chemotaxis protein
VNAKVLLVDDDVAVRQSLGHVLQSEGYQVLPAASGQEAIEVLGRSEVALVLLDINMPGLNGWDAFDQMMRINPFLPVIVITARPNQQQAAAEAGATALMEKPLALQVLLELMNRLIAEPAEIRRRRIANHETVFMPSPLPAQ